MEGKKGNKKRRKNQIAKSETQNPRSEWGTQGRLKGKKPFNTVTTNNVRLPFTKHTQGSLSNTPLLVSNNAPAKKKLREGEREREREIQREKDRESAQENE